MKKILLILTLLFSFSLTAQVVGPPAPVKPVPEDKECAHEVIFVIDVSHSICSDNGDRKNWNLIVNELQNFTSSITGDLKVGILLMGTQEDQDSLIYIHDTNAQKQINALWSEAKNICNTRRGQSRTGLRPKIDKAIEIFDNTSTQGVSQHLILVSDGLLEDDNPEYDDKPGPHWSWLDYTEMLPNSDFRVYSILVDYGSSSEKTRFTQARRELETGELFFWDYMYDYKEDRQEDLSNISFNQIIEYVSTRNLPTSKNPDAYTSPLQKLIKWRQNLAKYDMLDEFEEIRASIVALETLWEEDKRRDYGDDSIYHFFEEISREFQDKGYFFEFEFQFRTLGSKTDGNEDKEAELKEKLMAIAQRNNTLRQNLTQAIIDDPENKHRYNSMESNGYLKIFSSHRTSLKQTKLYYDFKDPRQISIFKNDISPRLNCSTQEIKP